MIYVYGVICIGYLIFAMVGSLAGVYLRWRDRQALAREETRP